MKLIALFWILGFSIVNISYASKTFSILSKHTTDHALSGPYLWEGKLKSPDACEKKCDKLDKCQSYNWNKDEKICQLNNDVAFCEIPLEYRPGFNYFSACGIGTECGEKRMEKPACCVDISHMGRPFDGDYTIYPRRIGRKPLKVYCKDMDSNPKDYLNLPAGKDKNYSIVKNYPGRNGISKFSKIRIKPNNENLTIDDTDLTFAETKGEYHPRYMEAGSCAGSDHLDGEFRVDLTGTGLQFQPWGVIWMTTLSDPKSSKDAVCQREKRNMNRHTSSGRAGGSCGTCRNPLALYLIND
ncbi:uncharacterized protein LOC141902517 [Tubulanus polymorphus]|uniref:uncharacterized protein LOC141902517 n=1 Tax=Tubulanus polymorphus TaxID=672921 RepID=UPI003DA4481C